MERRRKWSADGRRSFASNWIGKHEEIKMEINKLDFQINADLNLVSKSHETQRIIELSITAPRSEKKNERPGCNLAFVIDRSGSMHGEKLEYVQKAVNFAIDLLDERDRAAVVIYDNEIETLSHSVEMNGKNKQSLKDMIGLVTPRNMTNLGGGWLQGCDELAESQKESALNRCLLLTDGLANVGITDVEELAHHAHELHNRGISTSTFGVGLDYNENLLETMARRGAGNYYFIENPEQSREIFQKELGELFQVTARDVELKLKLPAHVDAFTYGNWKEEKERDSLRIFIGDIPAGQSRSIFIKLSFPAATPSRNESELVKGKVMAKLESSAVVEEKAELAFKPVFPRELEKAKPDESLLRRFAIVETAHILAESLKLDRNGKRKLALEMLSECLERNEKYLEFKQLEYYLRIKTEMEMGMREANRKFHHESSQALYQRMDMPAERYKRK